MEDHIATKFAQLVSKDSLPVGSAAYEAHETVTSHLGALSLAKTELSLALYDALKEGVLVTQDNVRSRIA